MTTNPSIQAIVTALRDGHPADAERLSRQRLALMPDDADALLTLAMSLHFQRKLEQAVDVYRRLTELQPDSGVHWANYATVLSDSGDFDQAASAYTSSIKLDPDNPNPRIDLGLLQIQRHDYLNARETLLDALGRDPDAPAIRIHAAHACTLCQDFHGAEDLLKPWRQWLPLNDDELQVDLARMRLLLADAPGAQQLLDDLVTRNPALIMPRILLAKVEERLNLLHHAEARIGALERLDLDEATRREVAQLRALLFMRKGDPGAARALLDRSGAPQTTAFTYYYQLAKACDKLNDPDATMLALRRAHALQAEELKFSAPESFAEDAKALPAHIMHVSAEQFRQWPDLIAPDAHSSPVFIVGFPRSGTTLLEQMLDAHPALQSMDENPFFDRLADKLRKHDERIVENLEVLRQYDCDELRKRYLVMAAEKVSRRKGAQLVDKNPLNMLWLPMIYRLFPQARFILCLRHPCDVLLSCYSLNFRSSVLAAASASLERLAAAYVQAMRCWLHHVEVFQPNVLVSRYEDLVLDTTAQTQHIAAFLQLDDAAPMLQFDRRARDKGYIATPSYHQVIEPVNTKGLNRWLRYREYFEPVLPILEPMLKHWGYPTSPEV